MLTVVTGGTGFIGSHLVGRLLKAGHNVRALVRPSSDNKLPNLPGLEVRKGSLLDLQFVSEACRDAEIVFNIAGKLGGPKIDFEAMLATNVHAVKTLLDGCKNSRVRQFIHCSTPGVVGTTGILSESMPCRPKAPYERTKHEGEKIVLSYHRNGLIQATIIRPDFVYGPGDMHKLKMFKAIKKGRFPLIGGGKSLLHPTYVDDVIDGFMLAIDNPAAFGKTFHLAGPEPVSIARLVDTICSMLDIRPCRLQIPTPVAKIAATGTEVLAWTMKRTPAVTRYQVNFFSRDHASDISLARELLGYQPNINIEEGIKITVEWYKEQGLL